jgi:peptide/nickel transport system ATP-binding protein
MSAPLLEVRDLAVAFSGARGKQRVVEEVSFTIAAGEILGVVGESGSGKTVTALALARLLGAQGEIESGSVRLDGHPIDTLSDEAFRRLRGRHIAMIFQEPMTSLNPLLTVGFQIAEVLVEHLGLGRGAALRRAAALMEEVGIADAERRLRAYPHELSGGMRQRVMIALAMACRPQLLLADEPTTALDVTIQAQILDLLRRLRDTAGTAMMLITHDMGVIAETADRVVVMYAGQIVETAAVETIFATPMHPYTRLLLRSIPPVGVKRAVLHTIPGSIPGPADLPVGCRFAPRCPHAVAACREAPPLRPLPGGGSVRCWRAGEAELMAEVAA